MKYLLIIFSFLCLQSQAQVIRANPHHVATGGNIYEYLLDEYPGATAAFSYWKLSSSYAGPCVRVTNLNTAAEQDFGFINNYVDTAGIKTFVGATNAEVIFYDQSGSGNHTTKPLFGDAPRIIVAGVPVRELNGLWSFDFGTQATHRVMLLPTGFLNGATAVSYFQAASLDDNPAINGGVFGPSNTNSTGLEVLQLTGGGVGRSYLRINGTGKNLTTDEVSQMWDDGVLTITSIFGNATSTAAYKNTAAVTLTNTAAITALSFNGVYAIGKYNSSLFNASGTMSMLVIYASDQTANRAGIETIIANLTTNY